MMTEPRLTSALLVSAMVRLAETQGGFAAVLAKGDQLAGSILLVLREKGGNPRVFERLLDPSGSYAWRESGQTIENEADLNSFLESRQKFDSDSWILELDIPSAERFAAEMNAIG